MTSTDGVYFIGLYASFPVEREKRRAQILEAILSLEDHLSFKRIRFGRLQSKLNTFDFGEERLQQALRSIETGDADYLQLFPYRVGDNWVESYESSVGLDWESTVIQPHKRPPSPIDLRFGSAGNIKVQYPLSRFSFDLESGFQKKMLQVVKKLFVQEQMLWAFVHKGFHFVAPSSIGTDDIFRSTKDRFPLTSFDADLGVAVFFREFVKGAFWANFLNPLHLKRLGGKERIMREKPSGIIEDLGDERMLLQVGPSPLTNDESKAAEDYQRLRRFLKPVLMETGEDMMRIQREVLGSWKPPESADKNFRELLAETRKEDS